jgi:hypothetical protein
MSLEERISDARERKALRIAEALEAANITSDEAKDGGDVEWGMAAKLAGTRIPSLETRQIVLALIREREKRA